jgi:uncharacterized membrane-anchored protein
MFIKPGAFDAPFDPAAFALLEGWFEGLLGRAVRATQLALARPGEIASPNDHFSDQDLVLCDVADGAARLWSDFRLHDNHFGRLLLVDQSLTRWEAASIIQRLQELGNYR